MRASHLSILHALNGATLDAEGDPYEIPGIERDVVKGIFAAACGMGKMPRRWPVEFSEKYAKSTGKKPSEVYVLKDVVAALEARHPILNSLKPGELDWARLQFEESECFMAAMLELARLFDVATLPIHDSIVVAAREKELALETLKLAYERRLGFRPVVREV